MVNGSRFCRALESASIASALSSALTIYPKTSASLYALKTLRCHGLDGHALWGVTQATLVAQLLYASPFWRGFINAEETNRLQSILKQESCAIAKMTARFALYKYIVRRCGDMAIRNYPRWRRHSEFIRIENNAIRSAVPENPTL